MDEHYPLDEEGKTKGYIFLEYSSPSSAAEAVKVANNYKLDKQHTFSVNPFSDFDKYLGLADDWEPPKEEEYKDQGNLRSWLLDEKANDQFSIVYEGGATVAVHNNCKPEPKPAEVRPR